MDTGWAEGGQEEAHVCCSTQKGQRKLPDDPPELTRGQWERKKWRERRHDNKTGAAQTREDTFKTSDMASTSLLPPPHNPQPKSPFLLCYMAVLGAAFAIFRSAEGTAAFSQ